MKYDLSNDTEVVQFKAYASTLIEEKAKVELTKTRKKRSIEQNAYLHVVLSLYGLHFGYTLEESKTLLKRNFGLIYEKNGAKFLISTSVLDTKQMTDFIEYIRTFAGKNGCYIPNANEYLIEQFRIDKEIDDAKEFLK